MAKAGTSKYHTSKLAKRALNALQKNITDKLTVNDLDSYLTDQLRRDYRNFTEYGPILDLLNAQSDESWELSRQQQQQALERSEAANAVDTRNAVAQMRNALVGSASSGANVGAANATALQALLGLGQQNSERTTEGMQNWQNTSREAAAARAANAVSALESAREGTNSMYENATSAYGADHTYGVQGAAEAAGTIATSTNEAASQERQNNATNKTQLAIEQTTKKTKSTNTNKNK